MIIVIASAKGGSGKTTTAMHLAAWLSTRRGSAKQSIALHDADPNQNSAIWYQQGSEKYTQRFALIPQNETFNATDYDHLVIDSAGGRDEDLGALMDHSDLLIIPSRPAMLDLTGTIATVDGVNISDSKVIVLLNLCNPRRHAAVVEAYDALNSADIPAGESYVCQRAIVEDCPAVGATVNQLKGKAATQAWGEFSDAFKEIFEGRL